MSLSKAGSFPPQRLRLPRMLALNVVSCSKMLRATQRNDRTNFLSCSLANAARIFLQCDIEDVLPRILNAQIGTQMPRNMADFAEQVGGEKFGRFLHPAVDLAGAVNAAVGFHSRPACENGQVLRLEEYGDLPRLAAAAVVLLRRALTRSCGSSVLNA